MAVSLYGLRGWGLTRDQDGYREYKATFRVMASAPTDGPGQALRCPGLPRPGAAWALGTDVDLWVWCRPNATVKPIIDGENGVGFDIELTYSNKPPEGKDRPKCHDSETEDPLLQPQQLSGGINNKQEEASFDRFGAMITSSSWELLRGNQVEFDVGTPTIKISQNVPRLELGLCTSMMNTVNAFPIYGLARRMLKLSNFTWEEKYYGQCYKYYTRNFEFEVNFKTFDRYVLDEGYKALRGENREGGWEIIPIDTTGTLPDRFNPVHFVRYKDSNGENVKCVLDGAGKPIITVSVKKFNFDPRDLNWVAGVATLQLRPGHGLVVATAVTISGVQNRLIFTDPLSGFNGTFTITAVTPTRISWALPVDPDLSKIDFAATWKGLCVSSPATTSNPGKIRVEKYDESDFLLLGIPATFGG